MRLQILASGSGGNAALLWAGETLALIDAGLPVRRLSERLAAARIGHRSIDHVLVSHGHLDHARSAGILAKRHQATLHCAQKIQLHRALSRAPVKMDLPVNGTAILEAEVPSDGDVRLTTVRIPHDCDPTVAFLIEHTGRRFAYLTDMGEPREDVARALFDTHVLLLEANYDPEMLSAGPYPRTLQDRVRGAGGHLSNQQMAIMLTRLAGPNLHTLILGHISEKNNTHALAESVALAALERLGRTDVRVIAARQDVSLDPITV